MTKDGFDKGLLAKSPFSPEVISQMAEADGWRWVYRNHVHVKEKHFEVCFTGFYDSDKTSMSQLAVDAGFTMVGSVTRSLALLRVGPNPGPSKLEKAKTQKCTVVTLEHFKALSGNR